MLKLFTQQYPITEESITRLNDIFQTILRSPGCIKIFQKNISPNAIRDMVQVTATSVTKTLTYKTCFSSEEISLHFLKANHVQNGVLFVKEKDPERARKKEILTKLESIMPENRLVL
ncbi:hypothetical protein JTB14_032377 [Gonioctena quinquepunctata]|nr:hypothetical protein JTB14_032377 [Gonioctena quinquepunctata]